MSACTPARKPEPRRRDPNSRAGQEEPRRALRGARLASPRPSHAADPAPGSRQAVFLPHSAVLRSCLGPCCPQAWTFLLLSFTAPLREPPQHAATERDQAGVAALELEPRSDSRTQRKEAPPTSLINSRVSLGIKQQTRKYLLKPTSAPPQVLRGDGRSKRGTDIQGRNGYRVGAPRTSHVHMYLGAQFQGCWAVAVERC